MDETTDEQGPPREKVPFLQRGGGWQVLWFLLHLTAVYAIVKFVTPWLAGWTRGTLLPLVLQRPASSIRFEFLYSHLLALSFVPAFLAGLVNARFKHKAAQFVWLVPAAVLGYKFATFPAPSYSRVSLPLPSINTSEEDSQSENFGPGGSFGP